MSRRSIFPLLLLLVTIGALAIRVPQLGRRPMHADEAVQAARFRDLWEQARYLYDPNEFHGPTLTYATLPSVLLGGQRTFAETTEATYRMVPVVFGGGLILLLWWLGDALGRWATLWAALFAALSPAMVFYSRYYIHEMLLVFFTLASIACGWRYFGSRKGIWCFLAGGFIGLMQATKETAVLAYFAAAVAFGCTVLYDRWFGTGAGIRRRHAVRPPPSSSDGPREDSRVPTRPATVRTAANSTLPSNIPWWHLAGSGLVAVVVAAVFLSSFFTNPRGPLDGLLTYVPWLHRAGGASPHAQPWYDYLHRLVWWRLDHGPIGSEGLIVVLAIAGFARGLFESRSVAWPGRTRMARARLEEIGARSTSCLPGGGPTGFGEAQGPSDGHAGFMRWIGFYTWAMFLVYSTIPYKTPWCLLQFLIGMVLLAGAGAAAILRAMRPVPAKAVTLLVLLALTGQLGWQAYRSSYLFFADQKNPYVYAQTSVDTERLADRLEQLAAACDSDGNLGVQVIWSDAYYWPLPWYLRRFEHVGFWTRMPRDPSMPLIIASPKYDTELTAQLHDTHIMTDFYEIRHRVFAELWVRDDLWEEYLRKLGRID